MALPDVGDVYSSSDDNYEWEVTEVDHVNEKIRLLSLGSWIYVTKTVPFKDWTLKKFTFVRTKVPRDIWATPKCECGSAKLKLPTHSTWCGLYKPIVIVPEDDGKKGKS